MNSQRALRLEPNSSGAPNVIGGAAVNSVSAGTVGATIAGGGAVNYGGHAYPNRVNAPFGTVSGGMDNTVNGYVATVGGGSANFAFGLYSTIGGGIENTNNADRATIGGGEANTIEEAEDPQYATIGGGYNNAILTNAQYASIGGGIGNTVGTGAQFGTVGGGGGNHVEAPRGTVTGGHSAVARNYGQWAYASGLFSKPGDAQASLYVLRGQTLGDDTYRELFLDGNQTRIRVPTNAVWTFHILVVGVRSTGSSPVGFEVVGVIQNYAGHTVFSGSPSTTRMGGNGFENFYVASDPQSDAFLLKAKNYVFAGDPPVSMQWVARVETVELTP